MIFFMRIDWKNEAEKASNFTLKKNQREDVDSSAAKLDDDQVTNQGYLEENQVTDVQVKNLKRKLIKKATVFISLLALFVVSLFTQNLNKLPASSESHPNSSSVLN
jgi:hypothetical protein